MEMGGSGFDIDNHLNANLTDQWDGFQGETFTATNVSLDMENEALSAEFTGLPLPSFEFEALPNISPPTEIGSSNDLHRIENANTGIGKAYSANYSTQQVSTINFLLAEQANDRFCCDTVGCTRSYKRLPELKRHKAKHSGIRGHACTIIGYNRSGTNGFTRKDHLRQHLKQVHGFISRGRGFGARASRKTR